MALVGYEIEKQKIDQKIREIRASLGGRRGKAEANSSSAPAPRRKRELSESARKRIAAAQKRRWAEHRKRLAQAAKEE
ncbi:MAG: hypothetical protein WD696_06480 [Bryobacteraceae bacterium]